MRFSYDFLEVKGIKKHLSKNSLLRFIFNRLKNLFDVDKSNLRGLNHFQQNLNYKRYATSLLKLKRWNRHLLTLASGRN